MSRYRPPRAPSSTYITAEGQARLQAELRHLWKEKRPEVTQKVSEAAKMGDRSENAEYIYGKRQLREIDSRIQFLSRRLDVLKVIDKLPNDRERIYFGAWITLETGDGSRRVFRIVGADEFDAEPRYISIDAPLARALIGKHVGDEVTVSHQVESNVGRVLDSRPGLESPAERSNTSYVIIEVSYRAPERS